MESPKFKVGDVVTLRSDKNTKMTVSAVSNNICTCLWFDVVIQIQSFNFVEEVLELSAS